VDNPRAPLFAAVGAALIAILLVLLFLLPKMGQVSTAKEDLAAAQAQQQTLEVQKNSLVDLQGQAGANRKIIDDVNNKIPPTADEPGLIQLLNKAALSSGLDLATMAPSPPTFDTTSGLSTIIVSMSAQGTYNEVTEFAYRIETLPRAAKITSIALVPAGATDALGNQLLSLTAQLEAYTSDTSAGPGSSPGPTTAGG
jgi:Tfp pilus assembly protein PilO